MSYQVMKCVFEVWVEVALEIRNNGCDQLFLRNEIFWCFYFDFALLIPIYLVHPDIVTKAFICLLPRLSQKIMPWKVQINIGKM